MHPRPVLAVPLLLACLVGAAGCGAVTAAPAADRDQAWREDLRFIEAEVRAVHPKPFFRTSEQDFDAAARQLERRIPQLDDAEVVVELMRLVARIGDGHTRLDPSGERYGFDRFFPVRVYPFPDGLFVQSAAPAYAALVGGRVLSIGDLPAAEALARAASAASADNEMARLDRAPLLLTWAPVVRALGIAASEESLRFVIETPAGERREATVAAVEVPGGAVDWYFAGDGVPVEGSVGANDGAALPLPLYLQHRDRAYWFEHLPERRLLYLGFNRVAYTEGDETFARFIARFFDVLDHHDVDRVVVDLRHNHGGDNQILKPLIHGFIRRAAIDRPGHLFVLIGRSTFSAAVNCTTWLETETEAVFVGEPTGGPPNQYGDAERLTLPRSGLPLFVSHWLWQGGLPWDERLWIAPQIAAQVSARDYRENRDPGLDAALRWSEDVGLAPLLRKALAADAGSAGDIHRSGALAAAYAEYKRRFPDRWGRTSEKEVNQLGYELLGERRFAAAIAVLELDTAAYPGSANTWDSLAEAHLESGDRERAIELYRKALAVDPKARNAAIMLARLGAR